MLQIVDGEPATVPLICTETKINSNNNFFFFLFLPWLVTMETRAHVWKNDEKGKKMIINGQPEALFVSSFISIAVQVWLSNHVIILITWVNCLPAHVNISVLQQRCWSCCFIAAAPLKLHVYFLLSFFFLVQESFFPSFLVTWPCDCTLNATLGEIKHAIMGEK